MVLAALLFAGILTMWIPARWALTGFQFAVFAFAAIRIVQRRVSIHPVGLLLAVAIAWSLIQAAAGWSINQIRTLEEALNWVTNLAVFSLAMDAARNPERRERFLHATLIFGLTVSILAMLTVFSSPAGKIAWLFDSGSGAPTLGPFVYRNQYAAFIEAILPLALVRSLMDRQRGIIYAVIAAILFASVIAGGSRTGTILCSAEIVAVPVILWFSRAEETQRIVRVTAGTIGALVLLAMIAGWQPVWNRLQEPNPYSLRADLMRSSFQMIKERPITGFGLGTWPEAYPGYALFDDGLYVNQAHSDWVQWAVEGGIPLLVIMLAVASACIRPAFRSIWGVGILSVLIHCLVDYPMQQRPALAAFFFSLIGMLLSGQQLLRKK